jgi:hypothetical protein
MPKIKPLLFVLENGQTIGDQKPIAILAVNAALAGQHVGLESLKFSKKHAAPVTIACFDPKCAQWLPSIQRFALYLIGDDYEKVLDIQFASTMDMKERSRYMEFGVAFWTDDRKRVLLDFGESESKNRFTSRILSQFRPKSNYFGSLFLPVNDTYANGEPVFWSNTQAIGELSDFVRRQHKHNRKIITIAGSMQEPFSLDEIHQWLESDEQKDWSVLLMGYKGSFERLGQDAPHFKPFKKRFKAMDSYVEFEDIARVTEFFVSNCGAGSSVLPIACSCPQLCRIRIPGMRGNDKKANKEVVEEVLKLGPTEVNEKTGETITFADLMQDISVNIEKYTHNTMLAQKIVDEETEAQNILLFDFFTAVFTLYEFQKDVLTSGIIPKEFALSH